VRRESGRWQRCDIDQLVIPQSMKEAIGSRLDRVSQEANEVLRAGAVLGKTFTFAELQSASGEQSEDALLDALDEAVGAQLIAADRSDSFTFTHDKIREVLYEELNPIRRRRLHRQALKVWNVRAARPPIAPWRSWPTITFRLEITSGASTMRSRPRPKPSAFLLLTKRLQLTVARAIVPRRWIVEDNWPRKRRSGNRTAAW